MNTITSLHSNKEVVNKIKIILAENNSLMRYALRISLDKERDLEVIAETADGKEAVELSARLFPNIVLIDEDIPLVDGLAATRQIKDQSPDTKVLVLTDKRDILHTKGIISAGADGYISKTVEALIYIHYIRKIMDGEHPYSLAIGTEYTEYDTAAEDTPPGNQETTEHKSYELTERELQILKCVATGMQNKDIALRLNLGEQYVKTSLSTIYLKLGVSSRTEAVAFGLKSSIISINDLK